MAPRYRKIYPHMWADAKVVSLSRPQPNAQTLWVHLLAGEQTEIIPGVCRIGEAAFAEQLGWSVEGLRKPFGELFRLGMVKVDWTARLVWVPNALRWNPPDNPNVVKSWREPWRHVPECELKHEIWQAFKDFLEPLGKGFAEGFAQGFPEPYAKPVISDQGAVNSDQDLRSPAPENEFSLAPTKPKTQKPLPVADAPGLRELTDLWFSEYERFYKRKPTWNGVQAAKLKQLIAQGNLDELRTLIPAFFAWKRPEVIRGGHSLWKGYASLIAKLDELRADLAAPERRAFAAIAAADENETTRKYESQAQMVRVDTKLMTGDENATDVFRPIGHSESQAAIGNQAFGGGSQPADERRGGNGVVQGIGPIRRGPDAVASNGGRYRGRQDAKLTQTERADEGEAGCEDLGGPDSFDSGGEETIG